MICGINRGCTLKKNKILCNYSKYNVSILKALEHNGYVYGYFAAGTMLHVYLKYDDKGRPLIRHIKILCRPSKYHFADCSRLAKLLADGGEYFLTSSRGVISIRQAIQHGIGGKLLFKLIL
jgi:small subunit ribosomal protein S8